MSHIIIGTARIDAPSDLVRDAGFIPLAGCPAREESMGARRRLARALSEGLTGEAALLRAIALGDESRETGRKEALERTREATAQAELRAQQIASAREKHAHR